MSETFEQVVRLVQRKEVRISDHGYGELASESLYARDAIASVGDGVVVEDYPDYPKGPCVFDITERSRRRTDSRRLGYSKRQVLSSSSRHCIQTGPGAMGGRFF
jgi:hypothetical protein